LRDMRSIIMRCELTFRLRRTRPAHVRSSASEILSRIRSWAGYTIDTRESNFSEATPRRVGPIVPLGGVCVEWRVPKSLFSEKNRLHRKGDLWRDFTSWLLAVRRRAVCSPFATVMVRRLRQGAGSSVGCGRSFRCGRSLGRHNWYGWSAGEPASTVPPSSTSRALSFGSSRPALTSLLSLSMISTGVFLGAPRPNTALGQNHPPSGCLVAPPIVLRSSAPRDATCRP
jgi:hypothetical protein